MFGNSAPFSYFPKLVDLIFLFRFTSYVLICYKKLIWGVSDTYPFTPLHNKTPQCHSNPEASLSCGLRIAYLHITELWLSRFYGGGRKLNVKETSILLQGLHIGGPPSEAGFPTRWNQGESAEEKWLNQTQWKIYLQYVQALQHLITRYTYFMMILQKIKCSLHQCRERSTRRHWAKILITSMSEWR